MDQQGYYRYPTVHGQTVVFASEGDLWTVPAAGGPARRLTANPGQASWPALSPDGAWLAFTGRDEGQTEAYCMPAAGGPSRRLTFLGADLRVAGWHPDGRIVVASNAATPFAREYELLAVPAAGGEPELLPTGPALSVSFGPAGGVVIARHMTDLARWKRYRGGLTGDLWIDAEGIGAWRRLIELPGNVAMPLWVGDRLYFVSDHEGVGNLYSCTPTGGDLARHTHHGDFYVRHPSSDGRQVVYHAGADLYLFDPDEGRSRRVHVDYRSPRSQRKRRFVPAASYLQSYHVHPRGHSVALTVRGKPVTMAHWEGAVVQHGVADGVRYRLAAWLADGKRLVVVSDADGEEALEVLAVDGEAAAERLAELDVGRPVQLVPAPVGDLVAVANHRLELVLVDLGAREARVLDRSRHDRVRGLAWSPDGRWIAYGFAVTRQTSIIKLAEVASGATHEVTRTVLHDACPAFDPEGKYLYFLSQRDFNPVYDNIHFDLNFPRGTRPHLITLRADTPSPFVPVPRAPGAPAAEKRDDGAAERDDDLAADGPDGDDGEPDDAEWGGDGPAEADGGPTAVRIDLEGIAERVLAFPVPEGRYGQLRGGTGEVLFTTFPLAGALGQTEPQGGTLESFAFQELKRTTVAGNVHGFELSADGRTVVYRSGQRLRALKAGVKAPDGGATNRAVGWLDLGRVRVSVDPGAEWRQMFRETWRLQRDQFWDAEMSGVDWQAVYERYEPLLARVATRAEFSDLLWEMQGELGTSHAYEFGGDYPPEPAYGQGFLGAELRRDEVGPGFRVARIVRGDVWNQDAASPLARAGVGVQEGDRLVAVGGRAVGDDVTPAQLLVHQAGLDVRLTFERDGAGGEEPRRFTVTVRALCDERPARYRDWVTANRRHVHEATGGKVGYVHVPDMGPGGYAEFHRGYLAEVDREALVVDVRYNAGGHVSQLVLEKLARRRLGYDAQRWGEPIPYPSEAVAGPMVALANEFAGSDGDIFTHAFKMLRLGPLVGRRTWGGVIGINMRESLVDGGVTTQPEFSHWFHDVHWGLENYGTEPDVAVEITPGDYVARIDAQLDRAITEALRLLAARPVERPPLDQRPRRALPRLPDA